MELKTICEKCGAPLVIFYNAGLPVWGCEQCRMKQQQIVYSDHTEAVKWDE